jgi:hypothetical protein
MLFAWGEDQISHPYKTTVTSVLYIFIYTCLDKARKAASLHWWPLVSETLRKYPPLSNLTRVCRCAYTIPDTSVQIDDGTPILIPVYAIHHDPEYYPDPKHFGPDRFMETKRNSRHAFTYLPFGEGPCICLCKRIHTSYTNVTSLCLWSEQAAKNSEIYIIRRKGKFPSAWPTLQQNKRQAGINT